MRLVTETGSEIVLNEDGTVVSNGRNLGKGDVCFCPHDVEGPESIDPTSLTDKPAIGSSMLIFSAGEVAFQSSPIETIEE